MCVSLCWNDYEVLECDTRKSLPFYMTKMHYVCESGVLSKNIIHILN